MKLSSIIVSVLVISLMLIGALTYLGNLQTNYEEHIDMSELGNTSKRLEEMQNLSRDLQSGLIGTNLSKTDETSLYIPYRMVASAWKAIKLTWSSLTTMTVFISSDAPNILSKSGIVDEGGGGGHSGAYIFPIIVTIIVVLVVFLIVQAFIKWRLES